MSAASPDEGRAMREESATDSPPAASVVAEAAFFRGDLFREEGVSAIGA
jgi:hypothetical protein